MKGLNIRQSTTGPRALALSLGACAIAVLSGCAGSSRETAANQDQLTRAQASIEAAEKAGAYQYGSAELNRAREKLAKARDAAAKNDDDVAGRLAVEAGLDAELAASTARNQEIQAALTELQQSNRTLQTETQRNTQRAPQ